MRRLRSWLAVGLLLIPLATLTHAADAKVRKVLPSLVDLEGRFDVTERIRIALGASRRTEQYFRKVFEQAARALKAGAAGYATKDSDPALLITAIRKVAGGGRYIDPALADRMVFEVGLTDSRPPHAQLSEREFSVFERLVRGEGVNDIALHLAVSNKTVSTHKARLMQKLGLHSVADLVRYAMEHKLL